MTVADSERLDEHPTVSTTSSTSKAGVAGPGDSKTDDAGEEGSSDGVGGHGPSTD